MNYPFKLPFFAHPPNKTTLDKAYFNVILQLFQLSSCVLQLLKKKVGDEAPVCDHTAECSVFVQRQKK